jgi:hypothetical protein
VPEAFLVGAGRVGGITRKRLPVRQLDAAALDGFYAELRRRGGRGRHAQQPLSPSTVRAVHAVLSGSLKQAVAWG